MAKQPRIELEVAKFIIPQGKGELTFSFPPIYGDYREVGKAILSKNPWLHWLTTNPSYQVPTGDDYAQLFHSMYCVPKIKNALKLEQTKNRIQSQNAYCLVFNRTLSTPDGLYVVQDLDAKGSAGSSKKLSLNKLEKAISDGKEVQGVIFSKDGNVRFAKKGENYGFGKQTISKLGKSRIAIAYAGLEGAEKFAEFASNFKLKPEIWGMDVGKGKKQLEMEGVSALDIGTTGCYKHLIIGCNTYNEAINGFAFAVRRQK